MTTTWEILKDDARIVIRDLKRWLYRLNDIRIGLWCDGCQMSWPGIPHTCSGRHLYPIHRVGNIVTEFEITYYKEPVE